MWMKKATKITLIPRVVRQNMLIGNVSLCQATRRKQLFATSSSAAFREVIQGVLTVKILNSQSCFRGGGIQPSTAYAEGIKVLPYHGPTHPFRRQRESLKLGLTASFDLVLLKLAAGNAGKDLELLECLGCLELNSQACQALDGSKCEGFRQKNWKNITSSSRHLWQQFNPRSHKIFAYLHIFAAEWLRFRTLKRSLVKLARWLQPCFEFDAAVFRIDH